MNEFRPFERLAPDPIDAGEAAEAADAAFRTLIRPWQPVYADLAPRIKIDLTEFDDRYTVKAEIPGLSKEDIDVRIDSPGDGAVGRVTISTISNGSKTQAQQEKADRVLHQERQQRHASRTFSLACAVDEERADARYKDGVLLLNLPKKTGSSKKSATTLRVTP